MTAKTSARIQRTDGEATRTRLIEAAGQLFAQHGFVETTNKAVAQSAGTDLALINYHFGGRNGLYQAVLLEAHRRLIDLKDLQKIVDSDISAEDRLYQLIDSVVARVRKVDSWYLRVLAREIMAPSTHIRVLLEEALPPKLLAIKRILSEVSGIREDDPALLLCLLNVAAPCLMLLVVGDRPGPLQQTLQVPHEALVNHLHAFAVAGLKTVGNKS